MEIKDIIMTLITADRCGADEDIPEGSRYIQISETFLNDIVECLKNNEPVIKTYHNIRDLHENYR